MSRITLLDGGLGQELVHRSGDRPTPLWSTQVMLDHPGMVQAVHHDFMAAGATVIATNTYALHNDRLVGTPMEGQRDDLIALALAEAKAARAVHPHAKIGGSIGPIKASYRPDLHPDHATAAPIYASIARALAPHCDLILCETVASVAHARAIVEGAQAAGLPIWVGLTLDDEDGTKLRSGELLADALPACAAADAILVNCIAPEAVPAALPILATSGKPYGAYPNGFTQITKDFLRDKPTVDALSARRDLTPDTYAKMALSWVDQGATLIGGCCEISPTHIAALATALRSAGHTIV